LVLTHEEAIRLSSEARASGDREEARKYSRIARDLQDRATTGETKVDFYDTKSGRIRHSTAGSETYVDYMTGASERYVPITETQVKEIRQFHREQPDQPPLIIPRQTVTQEGRVLYRVEPGAEPLTAELQFPVETQQWTVTYDIGSGERKKTFETEEEATGFIESLTVREEEAVQAEREQRFTTIDQVGEWSRNVVARTASVNEQTQDFNDQLKTKVGFIGEKAELIGPPSELKREDPYIRLRTLGQDALRLIESPFVAATTPIRARSERLRTEAAEEKAGFKGLSKYFEGVALAVGASAFDVATFQVRPGLVVKTGSQVGRLIADPKEREALVETVATDPFGFTAEVAGGAFFGAKLVDLSKFTQNVYKQRTPITSYIRSEIRASKAAVPVTIEPFGFSPEVISGQFFSKKLLDIPVVGFGTHGVIQVPPRASTIDVLKRVKFLAERETSVVDFSKLLKEETLLYSYPEEVVQAEVLARFGPKTDTTFNKKFGKWTEKLIQEDFGITPTRGSTIRTGKSGYLGFGKSLPKRMIDPFLYVPEPYFAPRITPANIWELTREVLNIPSGRPRIPIDVPKLGAITKTGVSITDVLTGASIAATRPRPPMLKTKVPQIQEPGTVQQNLQRFRQKQSNLTRNVFETPGITVGVTQQQTQPTLEITLPTIKQIPAIIAPPVQVPRQEQTPQPPPPPTIIPPLYPPRPPRKPPTAILDYDPRKKKRKPSKKAGIKKAVEKRIDPLEVINWDPRKRRKKR